MTDADDPSKPLVWRRTVGSDDEIIALGEIAVIAGRLEFVTRQLLVMLVNPREVEVGVEMTRDLNYEPMLERVARLIELRDLSNPVVDHADEILNMAREAMRQRNGFLHARWHWSTYDVPGTPAGRYIHHRKTGQQVRADVSRDDLEAVADQMMQTLGAMTTLAYNAAVALDAVDVYEERIGRADYPD